MVKNSAIVAMLIATVLVVLVLALSVHSSANDETKELQLVHIIMRHGIRTPVDTYPNDPHINDTFYPVGWGQLTNEGKLALFETGKFFRERYGKFLGSFYNPKEFYVQATDVDRTKASLQLVNAGLWPPEGVQKWGPLDWQPIPIHSEPLDQDSLLLVRIPCAEYNYEFQNVFNSTEIKTKLHKYDELLKYIEEHSGKEMRNFDDIQDVYATLLSEQKFNLTLPEWTKGYFPDKMQEPAAFHFKLLNYNPKLKSLRGGVLLKKIITDWNEKLAGTIKPKEVKAYLYGGHDSTIANLLSALNVFDPQVPGYGVAIMLEFSRDKITNEFGVEVFLRNSTELPPYQLQIPGCDKFCPLAKVITLTKENMPSDLKKECVAGDPNYVPPPPSGP